MKNGRRMMMVMGRRRGEMGWLVCVSVYVCRAAPWRGGNNTSGVTSTPAVCGLEVCVCLKMCVYVCV